MVVVMKVNFIDNKLYAIQTYILVIVNLYRLLKTKEPIVVIINPGSDADAERTLSILK